MNKYLLVALIFLFIELNAQPHRQVNITNLSTITNSVNFDPNSFFPHSVGNIWEYDTPYWGISRFEIIGDSLGNDGLIYLFYGSIFDPSWSIDTSNSTVYYIPGILNWLYYRLNADPDDYWVVQTYDTLISGASLAVVSNVYLDFVFGQVRTVKEIVYGDSPDTIYNPGTFWPRYTELLASGIGMIRYWAVEPSPLNKILIGCVIDGDTLGIITDVEKGIKTANEFYLSQNYPNPFNPMTNIRFRIANFGFVSLKVYDVLGNEIRTLVNEEKPAGEYVVTFNGSGLASGVYVYRLTFYDKSIKRIISKKMILLK